MPIQVTCPGCLSRFTVSDKYAGKKGPCPKCKKEIMVPDKAQEVVIHAPEVSGPKDSKGVAVLKPIKRGEFRVGWKVWAMVGLVPAGASQPPHRHQSVALDLIVDCPPGCYTLVGTELDPAGQIHNPQRIDWEAGGVFVTPPGHWHAHVNTSDRAARLLPIQDAGLHTYLRSLDIRFAGGLMGQE